MSVIGKVKYEIVLMRQALTKFSNDIHRQLKQINEETIKDFKQIINKLNIGFLQKNQQNQTLKAVITQIRHSQQLQLQFFHKLIQQREQENRKIAEELHELKKKLKIQNNQEIIDLNRQTQILKDCLNQLRQNDDIEQCNADTKLKTINQVTEQSVKSSEQSLSQQIWQRQQDIYIDNEGYIKIEPPLPTLEVNKLKILEFRGYHEIIFANGYWYDGEIREGQNKCQPQGFGRLFLNNNIVYSGNWKDGCFQGWGKLLGLMSPKIKQYRGRFRNGKPHGPGIIIYHDSTKYIGILQNGNIEGEGTYSDKNGLSTSSFWHQNTSKLIQ